MIRKKKSNQVVYMILKIGPSNLKYSVSGVNSNFKAKRICLKKIRMPKQVYELKIKSAPINDA